MPTRIGKQPLFSVKAGRGNAKVEQLVRELPRRVEAALSMLSYEAAQLMLEEVRRRAPQIPGVPDYVDRLVIRSLNDGLSHAFSVGVEGDEGQNRLESDKLDTTVIRFTPLEGRDQTNESKFLVLAGPWPADLVPFRPPHGQLRVEALHVSEMETRKLRNRLRETWPALVKEAQKYGLKLLEPGTSFAEQEVGRNLAFQVLRAEFGIGGPVSAHWRPAIRLVKQKLPTLVKQVERTLTDPGYTGWRRPLVAQHLTTADVRAIREFVTKL